MNGELLYSIYRLTLDELHSSADHWEDLSPNDQVMWSAFAENIIRSTNILRFLHKENHQ